MRKAKLTPSADQWKNWSSVYEKVYVSRNQKKRQQQGQELALVSLADLDGFFKTGKPAEAKGQNYDNWLRSVGKKTLRSWSAMAVSRAAPSDQHLEPVAPVVLSGDLGTDARAGGSAPTGVSQSSISGGQAHGYPPNHARSGGQTPGVSGGAHGSKQPTQPVNDLSVEDMIRRLRASGISESELSTKFKASQ